MGYNSRFTLHALRPADHTEMDIAAMPKGYMGRFQEALKGVTGWTVTINEQGWFFGGESAKFYEYEKALQAASRECPEAIWVVHIEGEEPGDIRACYAYRGVTYEEKMPPWVPPPPNMNRLPSIDEDYLEIPEDPPTPKQALETSLKYMEHSSSCPATRGSEALCNCPVSVVRKALAALPK